MTIETKTGVELIAEERRRQIDGEGWTLEHDKENHQYGDLAIAGACYALSEKFYPLGARQENRTGVYITIERTNLWPWHLKYWHPAKTTRPEERIKELCKAGALIAAEIDRLKSL